MQSRNQQTLFIHSRGIWGEPALLFIHSRDIGAEYDLDTDSTRKDSRTSGEVVPSFEAAVALAKALDLSLDYLAGMGAKRKINPLQALFMAKLPQLNKKQANAIKSVLEAF